jgi:S1-C subfamily serine protease
VQREFNLTEPSAVEVVSLMANGPAQTAGLREKDVIVSMDGHGISSVDDLQRLLARSAVGKIVSVTVIRHGGHRHQIDITPIQD